MLGINHKIGVNVEVLVEDAITGREISRQRVHNLVVNTGLDLIRNMLGGDRNQEPTHFAVGTGTAAVASTDTALGAEAYRDIVTARVRGTRQITYQLFLGTDDANGNALTEAGIFNVAADTTSTMYARILTEEIDKTSSITVTYSWTFTVEAVSG